MAFPTTGLLDDFNRADETPVAGFSNLLGLGALEIVTNVVEGAAANASGFWNAADFGADCEVYADIATKPAAGANLSIFLRTQEEGGATVDGYYVVANSVSGSANDTFQINRLDNRAATQLGATITQEYAAGEKMGLEAIGDQITAYWHSAGVWNNLGSRTDATYGAAGGIGIGFSSATSGQADNFSGGTVVAAGGTTRVRRSTLSLLGVQ